jgi:hypothetical protein
MTEEELHAAMERHKDMATRIGKLFASERLTLADGMRATALQLAGAAQMDGITLDALLNSMEFLLCAAWVSMADLKPYILPTEPLQ